MKTTTTSVSFTDFDLHSGRSYETEVELDAMPGNSIQIRILDDDGTGNIDRAASVEMTRDEAVRFGRMVMETAGVTNISFGWPKLPPRPEDLEDIRRKLAE